MAVQMGEAWVHVGAVETSYLRAGAGPALVLLARTDAAELRKDALVRVLCTEFRVFVPALPDDLPDLAKWLQNVIEGLGLEQPRLLLHDSVVSDAVIQTLVRAAEHDTAR